MSVRSSLIGIVLPCALFAGPVGFIQTNLVSDGAVPARTIDPDLVNPWGISFGPTTPFWVSDNGTGKATLYNGAGAKQGLVVTIPPPAGSPAGTTSAPTGTVFNGNSSDFQGDRFLFATEDGDIAGWQGGTVASLRAGDTAGGAVYKGLTINSNRLYATDFANGKVDVWDSSYMPISVSGGFIDPNLPAGYAPFGIQSIGSLIYVTYAKVKPGTEDDEAGPGFGFVDTYDVNGVLQQRLIVGVPGDPNSPLNSPWGIAMAPANFGSFGNLLLVGNFGDGRINAFNPTTGAFVDTLRDTSGNPIVIDGLWGLAFGNGARGFSPSALYFTAGLNDEADGLFGSIAVPEPGTMALLSAGLAMIGLCRRRAA